MTHHYRLVRSAVTLAALLLLPAMTLAVTKDHSAEIGLAYTFTHFDTQTTLEYRVSPTVMVGYNFTKRHGVEVEFTSTTATTRKGPSFHVDVDTLRAGYVFNAFPKPKVVSFFRLGLGVWSIDPEPHKAGGSASRLDEGDTSVMLYSGGGFRFFITDRVAIRVAGSVDYIDAGNGLNHGDIQGSGDLGFVFMMGGREPAEKPAAEEEKKP